MKLEILRLFSRLARPETGFPGREIDEALRLPEELGKALLELLEKTFTEARLGCVPEEGAHRMALYLAGKLRLKAAFYLVVDLASLPGDVPKKMFGDVLYEDLGRILASLVEGDPEPLKIVAEHHEYPMHVRGAALEALLFSLGLKRMTRDQMVEYLRFLLTTRRFQGDKAFQSRVVSIACQIYPEELLEPITEAITARRVDEKKCTLDSVKFYLSKPRKTVLLFLERKKSTLIDDLEQDSALLFRKPGTNLGLLSNMTPGATSTPGAVRAPGAGSAALPREGNPGSASSSPASGPGPVPVLAPESAGRNDPCPCGSGKKFKKCCMN